MNPVWHKLFLLFFKASTTFMIRKIFSLDVNTAVTNIARVDYDKKREKKSLVRHEMVKK